MEDNEVQIGNNKIGMSSEIKFTVKTFLYILGILFSLLTALFTWFYFNDQQRESDLRKEMSIMMKEYNTDVRTDIKAIQQQIFTLAQGQGEIKTDLKTVINQQVGSTERPNDDFRTNRTIVPNGPR